MKAIKSNLLSLPKLALIALLASSLSAPAISYTVNRAWSEGSYNATLTGTIDVPIGDYVIQNKGPHPITAVNLLLSINGVPLPLLDTADTSLIYGTGTFYISATATELTFDVANANGGNPADLIFRNGVGDYYAIGFNGYPGFEVAYTSLGDAIADVNFPEVFGRAAAIPDGGSTLGLLGLALLGLGYVARKPRQ